MRIAEVMNGHEYLPKTPNQQDRDTIFVMFYEVQPYPEAPYPKVQHYLKISYSTSGPSSISHGTPVRQWLLDTLAI